jgi:DNA-binding winged helix-turn-helix (wHTH) protein/Tol biopolymer transport system component
MSIAPEFKPNFNFRFGGFELDINKRELRHGSDLVQLTGKAFETLVYLLNHRERLVPKRELLATVWSNRSISENVVDQALKDIRKALRKYEPSVWVKTVYGEGYAFVGEAHATEIAPDDQAARSLSYAGPLTEIQLVSTTNDSGSTIRRFGWKPVTLTAAVVMSITFMVTAVFKTAGKRLELAPSPVQVTSSSRAKLSPIITDGNSVFFTEVEGGRYHLMRTTGEGAEPVEIPTGIRNPYVCDISPDSQNLLVRDVTGAFDEYGPLWIVPLGHDAPTRIPDVMAFDAAWSRKGDHIAVTHGFELLFVSMPALKLTRKIALPGYGWWPRWSPDGDRLRLTIMDAKSLSNMIWEVDIASGRISQLRLPTQRLANISAGDWTPDSRHFIFQVQYDGVYSIWAFPEFRSGKLDSAFPLTSGPMGWRGPTISRTANRLYARGQLTKFEVMQHDTGASQYRRFLGGLSAETVAFSRDMNWIAYTAAPGMALWKARANGLERTRIVPSPWQAALPRWSPDGNKIATMLRKSGEPWKIYVVSARDGGMEELVPGGSKEATPDWSPDGKRIVFGRLFSVEDPSRVAINVVDLASKQVSILPDSQRLFHPSWSPDGQYIVAIHSETFHLFLYDLRARQWRELTDHRAGFPNWEPDSRAVSFLDPDSPYPIVYRVNIKIPKVVTKIAELRDVRPPNSPFGRWIGVHPGGSILAVHDVSTDQIFAFQYGLR